MSVGWQPGPKEPLRSLQRKEPSRMWGKTIVGRFSEPMAMDISRDLRLRAVVIPPRPKGTGSPDHVFMGKRRDKKSMVRFAIDIDGTLARRNNQQYFRTCNEILKLALPEERLQNLSLQAFSQLSFSLKTWHQEPPDA